MSDYSTGWNMAFDAQGRPWSLVHDSSVGTQAVGPPVGTPWCPYCGSETGLSPVVDTDARTGDPSYTFGCTLEKCGATLRVTKPTTLRPHDALG